MPDLLATSAGSHDDVCICMPSHCEFMRPEVRLRAVRYSQVNPLGHDCFTENASSCFCCNAYPPGAYKLAPSSPSPRLPHSPHMHMLKWTQLWVNVTHAGVCFLQSNVQVLGCFDYPNPGSAAAARTLPQPPPFRAHSVAAARAMPWSHTLLNPACVEVVERWLWLLGAGTERCVDVGNIRFKRGGVIAG